jgi:hypothetical protein
MQYKYTVNANVLLLEELFQGKKLCHNLGAKYFDLTISGNCGGIDIIQISLF